MSFVRFDSYVWVLPFGFSQVKFIIILDKKHTALLEINKSNGNNVKGLAAPSMKFDLKQSFASKVLQ